MNMSINQIKINIESIENTAHKILGGDRDNYDGADGARIIVDLCGYCNMLIEELEGRH